MSGRVLSGRARSLPWVFPRFGSEGMNGQVFGELVLGFCRMQTCLSFMIHNGNKIGS